MIERPIEEIPGACEPEIIGVTGCSYACAGCPCSVDRPSPTARLVGFDPATTSRRIRELRPRLVELASGDLPTDLDSMSALRNAGLERIIVPLFGLREEHDEHLRIPGAYEKAMKTLAAAESAGLERFLVFSVPHHRRQEWPRSEYNRLRDWLRTAWGLRARAHWTFLDELPCYFIRNDYNEIDG
jgi:hypothetical protein